MTNNENSELETYSPLYRNSSLYIMLICGIIIILIGLYLLLFGLNAQGQSRFSNPRSGKVMINGWGTIFIGASISVFPIYNLIKQYFEKKKFTKDVLIQ